MSRTLKPAILLAIVLIVFTGLASIAWQKSPAVKTTQTNRDTIPKKNSLHEDKTVIRGDLDKAIDQVNKAKEELDEQLHDKDWDKMHKELEESLEKLNAENIEEQINNALKEIDVQKIQLKTQEAISKVDWEKMQKEFQKAQKEFQKNFNSGKWQKEMEAAMEESKKAMAEMKSIDMEKMQIELEKAQEELKNNQGQMQKEMERAKKDIQENLHRDFKKDFEHAREGVNRAAAELQNYKAMLTEMDKDGLLKANEPYNIEYKKGVLKINGKIQPENITNKYKHYFKKENVTIKKGQGDDDDDYNDDKTIDI